LLISILKNGPDAETSLSKETEIDSIAIVLGSKQVIPILEQA